MKKGMTHEMKLGFGWGYGHCMQVVRVSDTIVRQCTFRNDWLVIFGLLH